MTDTTSPPTDRLHTVTVVFASLVVALPLLVGQVIEAGFDAVNPAHVDPSQDLAYLRELLGFSVGFLGLLLLTVVALIVTLFRRERRLAAIALPLTILAVQLIVGLLALIMTGVVDAVEDSYVNTLSQLR